jgi:CheY-like chemotaxis protein
VPPAVPAAAESDGAADGAPVPEPEPAPQAGVDLVIERTSLAERAVVFDSSGPVEPPAPEPEQALVLAPAPDVRPEHVVDGAPGVDPEAGRRPLRVLVVDDDPDIRLIVSATLRKLDVPVEVVQAEDGLQAVEKAQAATLRMMAIPLEIVEAQDGVEALERARESTPDLAILDVMMPRMDGFDTCRALRENVRTAFVPILMLTASADQDSRTKGYLIGTDDYMAKPFLPVDLKLRVGRLLRRTYGI